MTGESYAGIYVPYLAREIIEYNKHPSSAGKKIALKGIMVGNACTDPAECYYPGNSMSLYQYEFLYNHAYMDESEYDFIKAACSLGFNNTHCKELRNAYDEKFGKMKTSILNIYAKCYNSTSGNTHRIRQSGRKNDVDEGNCDDSLGIEHWFNEPLIQAELHVR